VNNEKNAKAVLRGELLVLETDHDALRSMVEDFVLHLSSSPNDVLRLAAMLGDIRSLALQHFEREERLMTRLAYEGASVHASNHRYFARAMAEYTEALASGMIALDVESQRSLPNWLRFHLTVRDGDFDTWLAARVTPRMPRAFTLGRLPAIGRAVVARAAVAQTA
jgi:hemerythrin-like metal-binding protein